MKNAKEEIIRKKEKIIGMKSQKEEKELEVKLLKKELENVNDKIFRLNHFRLRKKMKK